MRRFWLAFSAVVALLGTAAVPAGAITFGQPDGSLHPQVGALLADYDAESPGPDVLCTGTVIAPTVFLTAGHCTAFLESEGISEVWVTFVPAYDEDSAAPSGTVSGTYVTHPDFGFSGKGGLSDPHDMAVVLLSSPVGVTPARLPTAGLLDQLKLRNSTGTRREVTRSGVHPSTPSSRAGLALPAWTGHSRSCLEATARHARLPLAARRLPVLRSVEGGLQHAEHLVGAADPHCGQVVSHRPPRDLQLRVGHPKPHLLLFQFRARSPAQTLPSHGPL
jgi:hypothetical protein